MCELFEYQPESSHLKDVSFRRLTKPERINNY